MNYEIEVIVEELLPAVRSIAATKLSEDYGYKQREIAEKLDITQPAVSQYLTNSRADGRIVEKLEEDPQTQILLEEIVDKAVNDEKYTSEMYQLINTIRDKGLIKENFQDTEKLL
ncbi:MAG: putative transcriptional regulator [Candidatus Nanohaloarchaea archaeon]|jgi:predicted transcriptional regulator